MSLIDKFTLKDPCDLDFIYSCCSRSSGNPVLLITDSYRQVLGDDILLRRFEEMGSKIICSASPSFRLYPRKFLLDVPYPMPEMRGLLGYPEKILDLFRSNEFDFKTTFQRTADVLPSWIMKDIAMGRGNSVIDYYGYIFSGDSSNLRKCGPIVDKFTGTTPVFVESSFDGISFLDVTSLIYESVYRNAQEYEYKHDPKNYKTMLTMGRMSLICSVLKIVLDYNIPGAIIEVGCHLGGCTKMMWDFTKGERKMYACDTFQGHPSLSEGDEGTTLYEGLYSISEKEARKFLRGTGVSIIPGVFPESHKGKLNKEIFCFAHIDCNLYKGTIDSLNFIYDRLSPGGAIIVDDYHQSDCPGVDRAVDQFCEERNTFCVKNLRENQALLVKPL